MVAMNRGGPCGCYAFERLLGRNEHLVRIAGMVVNMWLANDYLKFRHVAPSANGSVVAVWPGRHVAKVVEVAAATVTVDDSWNHHHVVSKRGLVFVEVPTGAAITVLASR